MLSNISNNQSNFFEKFKPLVEQNRINLFSRLENHRLSKSIIDDVKEYLLFRDKGADGKKLMGEYYPWIIKDIINLKNEDYTEITVNWLAVYSSICMIDDKLDSNEFQKHELVNSVADKVVAQIGTLNLFKIVNGTEYEKLFFDSIITSANGQYDDVNNSQSQLDSSKENSAIEKNHLLVGLAGAIAATLQDSPEKQDFIISFTRSILATIQLLDDVTDYGEDFAVGNMTFLLSGIDLDKDLSEDGKILEELLNSGMLKKTLERIVHYNAETLKIIQNGHSFLNIESKAIVLFKDLQSRLEDILSYVKTWNNKEVLSKYDFLFNIEQGCSEVKA